jgi:uncharacterized protein YejL (UPF0352 family)
MATSKTAYLDAYRKSAQQIKNNYNAQAKAATQRKNDYMQTVENNDAAWRAGQEDLRNAYLQNMNAKQEKTTNATNAQYTNTARQNYVNSMRAQRNLPEQLNALGIIGGASESSLIRMGTNYGTNVANNEMARAQALDSVAQQYADAINEYEQQYRQALLSRDDAKANQIASYLDSWNKELSDIESGKNSALSNAYVTALQNDVERSDTQEAKRLEQYAAGLAAYTNIDTLNKMIKNIRKDKKWASNPMKYGRVMAIRARIGEIKAQK